MGNPKKLLPIGMMVVVFATVLVIVLLGVQKHQRISPKERNMSASVNPNGNINSASHESANDLDPSANIAHAKQLINQLRSTAIKTNDIQILCYGNASLIAELRKLGTNAV